MNIEITGASEHNLKQISVQFSHGLTVVTGVSGSGKSSLVFNTLYHESRRRYLEIFTTITSGMRLLPAKVKKIIGLGPAVAIGQNLLNRNPNSSLATASGLHPFFRLLFARYGEQKCLVCNKKTVLFSSEQVIEQIQGFSKRDECKIYSVLVNNIKGSHTTLLSLLQKHFNSEDLIVDEKPPGRRKLMSGNLHRIELYLDRVAHRTPLPQIRNIIEQSISLGSRTIMVRTKNESHILSFSTDCPVCGAGIPVPEPKHFHTPCPDCNGAGCDICNDSGLTRLAGLIEWNGNTFSGLLSLSVEQAYEMFKTYQHESGSPRLIREITRRLETLMSVGLPYLTLDRPSPSLSRGESQRVRIAIALVSRLEDMLHVLDEPTIGLHPADISHLMPVLRNLPGPVVYVEHDRMAVACADHVYDLGPGAGHNGGKILFSGTPAELWKHNTDSSLYFSMKKHAAIPDRRPSPRDFIGIRQATCHNLKNLSIDIPLQSLTVVTGVSGSGKSTLVHHVLAASLKAKKPSGCAAIEGPLLQPIHVDQDPIGKNPRSNPGTYTGLASLLRDLFAAQTGCSSSLFTFNRSEGACPECNGMGKIEVTMKYLPSEWITCSRCMGERFHMDILGKRITIRGIEYSIADVFAMEIETVSSLLLDNDELPDQYTAPMRPLLQAFLTIGLGYLTLGQPSPTLSGGEAQRIKLVKYLAKPQLKNKMFILDEPSTGLHPHDVSSLLVIMDNLVRAGATLVIVEHNTDIIRAADWIIDLGPGPGPAGGSLLFQGPVKEFYKATNSITIKEMKNEENLVPVRQVSKKPAKGKDYIKIKGASLHNLKNISLSIPKNKLTVITGVSGSGKSSLVQGILETEAKSRFYETLSMYERQGIKEGADSAAQEITGLGVTLFPGHERNLYDRRSTVGTVTECSFHLSILLSYFGTCVCSSCHEKMNRLQDKHEWICPACGNSRAIPDPSYFLSTTYGAACTQCHGIGTVSLPAPEKLIIHPEKPLCKGAMYSPGFFPNGYFGKEFNNGHYMLLGLAQKYAFDPFSTPWNEMTPEAHHAFLFGDTGPVEVKFYNKKGFSGKKNLTFPGFYALVLDWDFGGTFCTIQPCPACKGTRLRREYLEIQLGGHSIYELSEMSIKDLLSVITSISSGKGNNDRIRDSLSTLKNRISFLTSLGLGYINLNRNTLSLSAGEAQRIKLAGLYGSELQWLTLLIDEPTRGLHCREVQALINMIRRLCHAGNTIIVVEHDPEVIAAADYIIDFGPGSGTKGGRIVGKGSFEQIQAAHTITGSWLRGEKKVTIPPKRRTGDVWMTLTGPRAFNLKIDRVSFPLHTLTGICGVSGSGKSTLILDTLGRALAPKKHTTSISYDIIEPGEYESISDAPPRTILIDQSTAHVTTPLAYLDLESVLISLYARTTDGLAKGIGRRELSAPCPECKGRGIIVTNMGFMPDIHHTCDMCRGTGREKAAWEVSMHGYSLPELFSLTIDHIAEIFREHPAIHRKLSIVQEVGLGYLVLRQPAYSLSGGEVQRLKIARELGLKTRQDTLYILDEPSVGLHLEDISRLTGVLHSLVDAGHTVIVCEHHPHILAACDWLVELGPGGGPEGGKVIASGTPETCAPGRTPTAPYLKKVLEGKAW